VVVAVNPLPFKTFSKTKSSPDRLPRGGVGSRTAEKEVPPFDAVQDGFNDKR
jgi:hypothetical protein